MRPANWWTVALVAVMGSVVTQAALPAAAADAPVLVASASTGMPGGQITLTLTGCPSGNHVIVREYQLDDVIGQTPVPGSLVAPDTYVATVALGPADVTYIGSCGLQAGPAAGLVIDVENPLMHLEGDSLAILDHRPGLGSVVGTDCPEGGQARVSFLRDDGVRSEATATPDERGDWSVAAPSAPQGSGFTVSATCGGFDYGSQRWAADPRPTTTTTTTTPVPTTAPVAPPAVARSGTPSLTG